MSENEILNEFVVESLESLEKLDHEIVQLEKQPDDREVLNSIFRRIHSIKGTCGFLELHKLEGLTHVGETLLDSLRAGRLLLRQEISSALLALLDAVRSSLKEAAALGKEGALEYPELMVQLASLNAEVAPGSAHAAEPIACAAPVEAASDSSECCVNHDLLAELEADPVFAGFGTAAAEPAAIVSSPVETVAPVATPLAPVVPTPSKSRQESSSAESSAPAAQAAETSLRVDVLLLDQLMNLVGELVLTRNQILQFVKTQSDSAFLSSTQKLNLITSELQESVMRTRMQPIANVWNKFPRVVRDVAKLCGKEVHLEMQGKETELDKTLLEAIKDPLTHLVRNSIDHGIELPAVRQASNKAAEGRLLLKAFHEGGQVVIEIADDGAGIPVERVKQKALEKGLIRPEHAAAMSRDEVIALIFAPGFSTAEQVTNISGRGVGMDVVRSNIERIGGKVEISSIEGAGTTVRVRIPLTLAIVPALIVSVAKQTFAIPQIVLLEVVRLTGEKLTTAVESVEGASFYRLRGQLLPLVFLNKELQLESARAALVEPELNIAVVTVDRQQFGLVVDEVRDTEEIVVKPLSNQLKTVEVFAGATIMGDGTVALILDIPRLARRAGVLARAEAGESAARDEKQENGTNERTEQLLLVTLADKSRCAIPLASVSRLEEIQRTTVERASGAAVVQYRGGILPLLNLGEYFGLGAASDPGELQKVVVYQGAQRSVGIVVESILDIVDEHVAVQHASAKRGIIGSTVLQKKVTDLLNMDQILADVYGPGERAAAARSRSDAATL